MRSIINCVALLLAITVARADESKSDWVKITPKDGKCEVQFPAKPTEKDVQPEGSKQVLLQREGGKAALMLQVTALPTAIDIKSADVVKMVFERSRDALQKAFEKQNAKIVSDKDAKVNDKYPARDIDMELTQLGLYRVRIILTGPKLYQITMLGPKDYVNGKEATKFWDSFKIKDKD
jgi:hypothetical protein